MNRPPSKILVASLLSCLLYSTPSAAQSEQPKALRLPQAERFAVELRQGMTPAQVEKLLGKPKRTSLRADAYVGSREPTTGRLQWTYSWPGGSQSERTLQVVFAGKSPEDWLVNSWDWTGY